MKYLLFGGAPNTGKTESIYRLTKKLIDTKGYLVINGEEPSSNSDFQCIIEKDGRSVLIHTHTDLPGCIDQLVEFKSNNKDISIIISSVRDESDYLRDRLFDELSILTNDYFEIPLGKVKRGESRSECIEWYLTGIEKLALKIVEMEPFNL
jgi:hypothetical protein